MLTAGRYRKLDRHVTSFDIVDAPTDPTPGRGTAIRTPEGYLEVDAFIARDGLLRYSDGRSSWLELRPRTELEQAAASFAGVPVTDEHPVDMLDAENAAQFTLGVVLDNPRVVVIDGVGYLRAKLKIFDAGLIAKIDAGQREISIGFWSDVVVEVGTFEGRRYDAKQTGMVGNHAASVPRGRAGPRVRVLMDTAGAAVHASGETPMWTVNVPASLIVAMTASVATKTDQAGMPVTMSKLVGPDGTELEVPTWLAALVEQGIEAQQGAGAPAPAAPPVDDPPPADPPAEPAEGDQFGEGGEMPGEQEEEDQAPPPLSRDAVTALTRKRARLERLAAQAGIPESADGPDVVSPDSDDAVLGRALVGLVLPRAKTDGLSDDALGALVDLAAAELVEKAKAPPGPVNPFELRAPARQDAEDDPVDLAQIELLRRQGVEI